jgi:uncharacterized membrane protein YfcA
MVTRRPCAVSNHEANVRPSSFETRRRSLPGDEEHLPDSRSPLPLNLLFVLAVGLAAGTISGIVGTGSSIMLMPVLVYQYGPKQAVPIMAIAAVMANLSRILAWWREVDWRACAAYSVTGIPAAALGARTLLALPSHAVDVAIGLFLIAMVPARHWLARHDLKFGLWHLAIGGAVIGYLTGIVVSTGPLSVPLFLFYGLTKGAFLATEAASSLGIYVSKSVTFQQFGALTSDVALKGLVAGASLMSGAFIAKRFVLRLEPNVFRLVMDGIMLAAGVSLLWSAATA